MSRTENDKEYKDLRRDGDDLLTLRALVLMIIAAGIGLLWAHNPRWGAAALGAVTVLALLTKMVS
jgi:hypothetical protein